MKVISTDKAPEAMGPYSQAIETGNMLFVSGQIPIDLTTGKIIRGGIIEQTEQVMKNLSAIVAEAGYLMDDIVKCTCLLNDINDFTAMNEVYGRFFTSSPPARAAFEIARLPKKALIEIDAIAVKK